MASDVSELMEIWIRLRLSVVHQLERFLNQLNLFLRNQFGKEPTENN